MFNSPEIDYISIIFQFLAGINFTLLYVSIFKTRLTHLFRDSEFKLYVTVVVIATIAIMSTLVLQLGYDYERAFRESLYQVVSFMTTTGVYSADVAQWPHITWIIIGCIMLLGACAGSTSGGFKCIRGVMLLKVVRNNFRCPDAVGDDNDYDHIRHRQRQFHHHRPELCQQRGSVAG